MPLVDGINPVLAVGSPWNATATASVFTTLPTVPPVVVVVSALHAADATADAGMLVVPNATVCVSVVVPLGSVALVVAVVGSVSALAPLVTRLPASVIVLLPLLTPVPP